MATETARRRQLSGILRLGETFAQSKPGSWFYINVAMRVDRVLLPLSRGRLSISVGQQVGMLESVGAKSGEVRRIPLLFIRDGDHVASSSLAPGGITGNYVAREAEGDERARLWDEAVDYYAGYATYKVRAGEREIPIVVLERA
jgi:hypothetical protein